MMRCCGLALAVIASAAHADPVRLMGYSDATFQDTYTSEVIKPFNEKGSAQVQFAGACSRCIERSVARFSTRRPPEARPSPM